MATAVWHTKYNTFHKSVQTFWSPVSPIKTIVLWKVCFLLYLWQQIAHGIELVCQICFPPYRNMKSDNDGTCCLESNYYIFVLLMRSLKKTEELSI